MDDMQSSHDDQELSPEDLEILRAFEEKSDWSVEEAKHVPTQGATTAPLVDEVSQDWLHTFIPEVIEDIARMRRAIAWLERETQVQPAQFSAFKHASHKVRGAAGLVECHNMATIAQYVEEASEQVINGTIAPEPALQAFTYAVALLEMIAQNLQDTGMEGQVLLDELAELFQQLLPSMRISSSPLYLEAEPVERQLLDEEAEQVRGLSRSLLNLSMPYIRVDARRVDQLMHASEQLATLRAALESAQEQFQAAIEELRSAQSRLRQIQPQLSSLLLNEHHVSLERDLSSSSLIACILRQLSSSAIDTLSEAHDEKSIKTRATHHLPAASRWDELDMERYNEKDMLMRSLTEAIADVTVASARVDAASALLIERQQEYMAYVHDFRSKALVLRLAPLKTLISRLQRTISTSALAHAQSIDFEVSGEGTEVDQGILDFLTPPLVQMVRTCITDAVDMPNGSPQPFQIWLTAQSAGNEVTLEVGFSMAVQGGAVETIREPLRHLNGTYFSMRNPAGGISFLLRFPRSRGVARYLMVRVGYQHLLVPFSQILRIEEQTSSFPPTLYHLGSLLGFPYTAVEETRIKPVLLLQQHMATQQATGVAVDEVIGEAEFEIKALEPYLQRPGISGVAVDGHSNALLVVDLPDLIRHHALQPYTLTQREMAPSSSDAGSGTILVADDSVSMRRSLCQTLRSAHYTVVEAHDGLQALELLLEKPPGVCLLDIEMPNLNGFDLLSVMQQYPQLARVKVAMLTSRSSEKHMQYARELGASAYLIKPCAQDTLLETVQMLLAR